MKRIWIVVGETGKWGDRQRWIVEAHTDERRASGRVQQLHELLGDMAGTDGHWRFDVRREREEAVRSDPGGDPRICIDSTGTVYSIEPSVLNETSRPHVAERVFLFALAIVLNLLVLAGVWCLWPGRLLTEFLFK